MQPTSISQREALEEAVNQYEVAALVSGELEEYLAARGIDEATARTFRLGVVEEPMPGHDRYRGKLAIPYLHYAGYPLTIRFRCIQEHNCRENNHGKYLGMADEPTRMFNAGVILQASDTIHVTEGEFDAMVLNQLGHPAVSIPGVQNWKWHYRTLLAGFQRIYVWGDPDDAGADLVNRVCRALPRAVGVRLKVGDVTDTYLAGGREAIESLID